MAERSDVSPRSQSQDHESTASGPGARPHLMLVDDSPGMAWVSGKLLETIGYRATVFDDPREALRAFASKPSAYDAVVTDWAMPVMSGEALTRALRALRPSVPVIVSSGRAVQLDSTELKALGVDAVLLKPWRLEDAAGALERVLRKAPKRPTDG